jgi:hypothetical protein
LDAMTEHRLALSPRVFDRFWWEGLMLRRSR